MPSIMPVSPIFGDSSGYTSGINSNKPTKHPFTVSITNPTVLSEKPEKYPPHVPKELQSSKPRNTLMKNPNGDLTGAPSIMSTERKT